ncbi:16936_t:CDS:2 [Funneliformis caledonium]|uniref:16936_t:CDS:1 n=1 Tax=Funneliformis caledonium TaxID=1117310 RepID=A0A9N8Z541_9GLOM|nr:16936_t:CDS:2 [Funneliformis caledonium]
MYQQLFATGIFKNKPIQHYELSNIKQITNESVNTYSARFNNLKRLVDPARVVIADPENLRIAVNEARAIEAETYYMRKSSQAINNDAIEVLTKQMKQFSLNYTNFVNILAA